MYLLYIQVQVPPVNATAHQQPTYVTHTSPPAAHPLSTGLSWRALGTSLRSLGVAGVPTGHEGLCEIRPDVCGEGQTLRVLLQESRHGAPTRIKGGGGVVNICINMTHIPIAIVE